MLVRKCICTKMRAVRRRYAPKTKSEEYIVRARDGLVLSCGVSDIHRTPQLH